MAAEVEDRGPIPNLALNAILIPVLDDTSQVRGYKVLFYYFTYTHWLR